MARRTDDARQAKSTPSPSPTASLQWINTTHPDQIKDKGRQKDIRRGAMNNYLQRAEHDPNSTDRRVINKRRGSSAKRRRASKSPADCISDSQQVYEVSSSIESPASGVSFDTSQASPSPRPSFSPDISQFDLHSSISTQRQTPYSLGSMYGQPHVLAHTVTTSSSSTPSFGGERTSLSTHRGTPESFMPGEAQGTENYSSTIPSTATPYSIGNPDHDYDEARHSGRRVSLGRYTLHTDKKVGLDAALNLFNDDSAMSSLDFQDPSGPSSPHYTSNTKLLQYMREDIWIDDLPEREELRHQLNAFPRFLLQNKSTMVSDQALYFHTYNIKLSLMHDDLRAVQGLEQSTSIVVNARGGLSALQCDRALAVRLTTTHLLTNVVRRTTPDPTYLAHASMLIQDTKHAPLALLYCPLFTWKSTEPKAEDPPRFSSATTRLLELTHELISLCISSTPEDRDIHAILSKVLKAPSGNQARHADSGSLIYKPVQMAAYLCAHAACRRIPLHRAAASMQDSAPEAPSVPAHRRSVSGPSKEPQADDRKARANKSNKELPRAKGKQKIRKDDPRSGVTAAMLQTCVRELQPVKDIMRGTCDLNSSDNRMERLAALGVLFWISLVGIATCSPPSEGYQARQISGQNPLQSDQAPCGHQPGSAAGQSTPETQPLSYAVEASQNVPFARRDSKLSTTSDTNRYTGQAFHYLESPREVNYLATAPSKPPSQSSFSSLQQAENSRAPNQTQMQSQCPTQTQTQISSDSERTQTQAPQTSTDDQDESRRFFTALAIRTEALIRKHDTAAVLSRLERFARFLSFLDSAKEQKR